MPSSAAAPPAFPSFPTRRSSALRRLALGGLPVDQVVPPHVPVLLHRHLAAGADRKSTRLNSSHEWISYAVVCRRPPGFSLFPYTTLFRSAPARTRWAARRPGRATTRPGPPASAPGCRCRSEEHTSELQSRVDLVCRRLPPPPRLFPLSLHDALPLCAGSHSVGCPSTRSCHHTSRSSCIGTWLPVRRNTTIRSIVGASFAAWSAISFSGMAPPLRQASSWVTRTLHSVLDIRSPSDSGEKPPKTTTCGAPMRAQASIAIGNCGIMPMYSPTRSPLPTPSSRSPLANWQTSSLSWA